jgi:ADP-ribose pyrophosphatase
MKDIAQIRSWDELNTLFPGDRHLKETMISSQRHFSPNYISLNQDQIRLPDQKIQSRFVLQHPGAAMIVPVFENGDVVMVRQFRYPVNQVMLEFPAGKIDPGETSLQTAAREVEEEVGLRSGKLSFLTSLYPCIGYGNEKIDLFLAEELVSVEKPKVEGENLDVFRVPLKVVTEWVWDQKITDPKTQIAIHWLNKRGH